MTLTLEPAVFRAALGRFATGVAVVTAMTRAGPVGMTVNSFSSVSLDPPLVLFCLRQASGLRAAFTAADSFTVNVLREGQREVARRFAASGPDRFGATRFRFGTNGAPLLAGVLAAVECARERIIPAGDHDIVLGRVLTVVADPAAVADPLVYYEGGYRSLDATQLDCWAAFF
jgi:3-hydroxy-9,10-secoandrosta-1,3,5(10)-triene-9,17-dione monooxygenase reductase component